MPSGASSGARLTVASKVVAYYDVCMSTTLTVRTDDELRKKLEDRATARGTTVSQVVREILRDALDERPLEARTGHLRGRLELPRTDSGEWRETLHERNWRP